MEAGISGLQEQCVDKLDVHNGDVEDAEFAYVLDNLPTSYDDFESKVLILLIWEVICLQNQINCVHLTWAS